MRQPGGIVKAAGLGDGPTQGKIAIAKLRLTMPRTTLGDFAFALPAFPGRCGLAGCCGGGMMTGSGWASTRNRRAE